MFATAKLYFDIGIGVCILLLIGFAGWQYDQAKLARKDAAAAGVAMTQLQAGLTQLQQGQEASNQAITAMADQLTAAGAHATTVRQRVVSMGNSDATIQHWLDTPLPVGGCMLDDTCGNGGAGVATQRGAPASVPASGNGAVRH